MEFDNAIGEGDGSLNGRRYFVAKDCFAKFLPLNSVVQVDQHIGRPEPGTMISVMSAAVRPGQMISIQRVSTVHVQHCFLNAPHRRPGHDILAVNNRLHCQCPSCGPCAHVVKPSKSQRLGKAGKNATHMCQFSTYTCCGMESQENALCSYSNEPPPPLKLPPIGNSWMEGSGYLTTLQEQQTKLLPNEFKQLASGSLDRKHSSRRHSHRHHHSKHGHHKHYRNHKNQLAAFIDKPSCDLDQRDNEKRRIEYLSTQSLTGGEMDKLAEKSTCDDQRSYYHESPVTDNGQRVNSANLSNTFTGNDLSGMLHSSLNDLNSTGGVSNQDGLLEIYSDCKKDSNQTNYRSSIDNRYLYPTDNYFGNEIDSEIDSDYRSEHRNSSRFSDKSKNILRSIRSLVSCLTPSTGSNISKRSNQRQFSDATLSYTQSEPKLTQVATEYRDELNYPQDDKNTSRIMPISKSTKDLRMSERSPIPAPMGYEDNEYKEEPIYNTSKSEPGNNIKVLAKPNLVDNQEKHVDDLYGKIAERILCTAALTHEETDRLNIQLKEANNLLSNNCGINDSDTINSPRELNKFMARIIRRAAHDEEFSRKILSLDNCEYAHKPSQNSSNNHQNANSRTSPKSVEFDHHDKKDTPGDNCSKSYTEGQVASKSLPRNFVNQSTTSGSMSISSRESYTSGTSLTDDIATHMNDATINIPVLAGTVPQAFQLSLTLSINPDPSMNLYRNNHSVVDSFQPTINGANKDNSNDSQQQRSLSAITISPPRYGTHDENNSTSSLVNETLGSNKLSKGISQSNGEEINFEEHKDKILASLPSSTAFEGNNPIYATIVRANKKDRPNAVVAHKLDLKQINNGNNIIKGIEDVNKAKVVADLSEDNLKEIKIKLSNGSITEEPRTYILEKKMDSREASDSGCENTGIV